VVEFCGDGVVNNNGTEACEPPGTDVCTDTCAIRSSLCGDGFLTPPEECEDANTTDGDGCSSTCTLEAPPACGDGNLDPGEECDDGNVADGDGCSSTCTVEAPPACGDGNTDPGEECDDGNTANGDGCAFDCTFESGTDLTQIGTIIARITSPRGSGSKDLEVIRDGDKPPVGDTSRTRQYDTFSGGAFAAEDWIGYEYTTDQLFGQVVFQEGREFSDGGYFLDVTVQVRQGGAWVEAPGITVTPTYAVNDGINYNTYVFDFDPIPGDAIRIHGAPGGIKYFISIGELEVFAAE
jgi:cysteine-rich repeat protein